MSSQSQHMVPNFDGTIGHIIKNQKTSKAWNTVRYSVSKQKPSTTPSRECNNCIWVSVVQLVAKISETSKVLKLKNSNLSSTSLATPFRISQKCQLWHRIRKQYHPRPAHSSEGSRNLPQWWSPRLSHGAVLAASKPLQV